MAGVTMGKYGDVALKAVQRLQRARDMHPKDAWNEAALDVLPDSKSSRMKGCPKDAFLGLCAEGAINNIPAGNYSNSIKNRNYALAALSLVGNDTTLAKDKKLLWLKVQNGTKKQHNGQLDVVIALWENGLINRN